MENLDIEKFSNIELSKDDVKSISDKFLVFFKSRITSNSKGI